MKDHRIGTKHKMLCMRSLEVSAEVRKQFGIRVRRLRKKANISQTEFAAMLGADRAYLYEIERGDRNITINTICRIAENLGVHPYVLLIPEEAVYYLLERF